MAQTAPMADDVLIDADTIRSPDLRHVIPAGVIDPFLYAEKDGVAYAAVSALDAPTIAAACPDLRMIDMIGDLGLSDLIASGVGRDEAVLQVRLRLCESIGLTSAAVPPAFPLETADYLRAGGVELRVDRALFADRRRVKSAAELAGIRRATRAAEAGLTAAREAITPGLTVEELRAIVREAVEGCGAALGDFTVSRGPQTATGHGPGSGAIEPGEPVIVDLAPQDRASACFSDIARTFVVGEPDAEIARWHELVTEVLEDAIARVRPGVLGRDLYALACDRFEAEGFATQRRPGATVMEGFPTSLGHGVALEIHEAPFLSRSGEAFVAGDVITIEPFLCRPGFGGVQVEEILLVTEDGCERLSGVSTAL
jgi:Xaa-Pro aminopeptidase